LKDLPSRFGTIGDDDPNKEQKTSNLEKHGAADWYDWSIANWGTKWSDCETSLYDEYNCDGGKLKTAMYTFDSAWGPPQEGIEHVSKSFKPLLFDLRYQEPGMMFCGYARYGNGETLHESVTDYVHPSEHIFHTIDWDYESEIDSGLDEAEVK
jgi:hypothetical protein